MSKLFDDELRPASEQECRARWLFGKNGEFFKCAFCGIKFSPGDLFRAVYTNDTPAFGNPLVCEHCNDTNAALRERWSRLHKEVKDFKQSHWWFFRRELE